MKTEEMRAMSEEQLELTLRETIKNLFHLRVASATDRLETPSEMRKAARSRPYQDRPTRAANQGRADRRKKGVTKHDRSSSETHTRQPPH